MTSSNPITRERTDQSTAPRYLRRLWNWLTEPIEGISTPERRRQARLLSTMLLALALLTLVGVLSVLLAASSTSAGLTTQLTMAAFFMAAYLFSRTKHYSWAVVVSVGAIVVLPMASYLNSGDYSNINTTNSLLWTIFALLLGNLFFSVRGLALLVTSIILGLASLPLINGEVTFQRLFTVISLNLVVGAIALINKRHRDLIEKDRQSELAWTNRELKALSSMLERRVAERTKGLALAAEIGHAISQVRNLDALLADAVDLIGARFNLYHVQVYLADESANSLTLRAGTGEVAKALIEQGHRLLFGPGSINGQAAAERRAMIVANTADNPLFRPNELLPETRSELAVPLGVGDRIVGVLDLQSAEANGLTEEDLPTFEVLAGQLAVAIENARLFTAINRARAELETRTADQSYIAWYDFMDAIHRRTWLGYVYDEDVTKPLGEPLPESIDDQILASPIAVRGEAVGSIHLERDSTAAWTHQDLEIVTLVSNQIAQKVENLRLLAEAEQYRKEAEEAARRLTREGWDDYLEAAEDAELIYAFDQTEVAFVPAKAIGDLRPAIEQPLTVGSETIGHLAINTPSAEEMETAELLAAVAERLSTHLENLRLSKQTEKALAATEEQAQRLAALNVMSEALNRAPALQDIFQIAVDHVGRIFKSDRASLTMITTKGDQVEIMAINGESGESSVGDRLDIDGVASFGQVIRGQRVLVVPDGENEGMDGIRSFMMAPLFGGKGVIGTINVGSKILNHFATRDESLILQIAALLGSTIERRRLDEEAQARAEREHLLRQITAKVHAAADAPSILRTAAQEINRALGLETFVYLNDPADARSRNGRK